MSDGQRPEDSGVAGTADRVMDAQVIVIGAGPGGSCAAYHLACQGVDVLLLEKSRFPREKVCGDGLTPRAVRHLIRMGVDVDGDGWQRNRGVRLVVGPARLELDWIDSPEFPDFGLTRARQDFDEILALRAAKAGARLHTGVRVREPVLDRAGRVVGVRATSVADDEPVTCRAPLVLAADGVAARLALSLGLRRHTDRPLGVAARRYFRSPARHDDPYLETWWNTDRDGHGMMLPGYGWVFGLGDGRVNVGVGVMNERPSGPVNARRMLDDWLTRTPSEYGLREEHADGPVLSAAVPMGFNRTPHYTRGMMLVGDSGGMVSPWNGEGITAAMESGELAADIAAQALARPGGAGREAVLHAYPRELNRRHGRYYRLGTAFWSLVARPAVTTLFSDYALKSPAVARLLFRLFTDARVDHGTSAAEHLVNAVVRAVPPARPGRSDSRRPRRVSRPPSV